MLDQIEHRASKVPRIFTYEMRQDDPAKCTSAKMRKLGIARSISRNSISLLSIVLNPVSESFVGSSDRENALRHGIVAIDCSWENAELVFDQKFHGVQRRLPALLAGNPTNYSKLGKLSTVEAVSAALYIMDFKDYSRRLLSIYKWGDTFLSLNKGPLEDYSKAKSEEETREIELAYFRDHLQNKETNRDSRQREG